MFFFVIWEYKELKLVIFMCERFIQLMVKIFINWDVVQFCFFVRNKVFVFIFSVKMEEREEKIKEERTEGNRLLYWLVIFILYII